MSLPANPLILFQENSRISRKSGGCRRSSFFLSLTLQTAGRFVMDRQYRRIIGVVVTVADVPHVLSNSVTTVFGMRTALPLNLNDFKQSYSVPVNVNKLERLKGRSFVQSPATRSVIAQFRLKNAFLNPKGKMICSTTVLNPCFCTLCLKQSFDISYTMTDHIEPPSPRMTFGLSCILAPLCASNSTEC